MTRDQLAQNIQEQMALLQDLAEANNQHPIEDPQYINLMQALSILSTLREREYYGDPILLEKENKKPFVACDGMWLKTFDTLDAAQKFIADPSPKAAIFGVAIIERNNDTGEYRLH